MPEARSATPKDKIYLFDGSVNDIKHCWCICEKDREETWDNHDKINYEMKCCVVANIKNTSLDM